MYVWYRQATNPGLRGALSRVWASSNALLDGNAPFPTSCGPTLNKAEIALAFLFFDLPLAVGRRAAGLATAWEGGGFGRS